MIERWELTHFPSSKDPQRYRLRLKATADDLKRLTQKLSVGLSKPFKTLSPEFNWACYLAQVGEAGRGEVERCLRDLCPHGAVTRANVDLERELSPLLEDFLETTAGQLAEPRPETAVPVTGESSGGSPSPPPVPPSPEAPSPTVVAPSPAVPEGDSSVPSHSTEPVSSEACPERSRGIERFGVNAVKGPVPRATPPALVLDEGAALNPRYTFEGFVIGPHNRFSHAAALAVAETPGRIYNPLFIYGSVGLGKTHLIQAVAQHVLHRDPTMHVFYLPAARLTHYVIEATRLGLIHQLPEQFQAVDLLLLDDVQFLAESEQTQEQFFHIFNLLRENNKQIVLTSDRPPSQLSTLADRIRSRFEWGLIADIKPPTLETRVAILKKKLEGEPLTLAEELLVSIATQLTELRALEGFLKRLQAESSLTQQPVTLDLVKRLMEELLTVSPPPPPAPAPPTQVVVQAPSTQAPAAAAPSPAPEASPAEGSQPAAEDTLRTIEVAFFFPRAATSEGGGARGLLSGRGEGSPGVSSEEELAQIKERFTQVMKKHKLKFQLVSRSDQGYVPTQAGNEREIVAHCQAKQMAIAVVVGPPPQPGSASPASEEFQGRLIEACEQAKLLLLWIPWGERTKDYRYLNLALDLTLTRLP